ncbi:MAG TPA: DUF4340 domain-containing protein [Balneolaceae bacterium]|nr:DUF4340 domain-containing protein [Balneolaceae bacterium]
MTNATKSLGIIFVALAVITAAVEMSSGPAASQAFKSKLVSVDTSQVNKIVINRPEAATITLSKSKNEWTVSAGNGKQYPASPSGIKRAFSQLNRLQVSSVATRDPEKYTRYKVDSTGTKITLFNGDKQLSSLIIGAPQIESRRDFNNYVRRPKDKTVYSVKGILGPAFSKKLDDWRNKLVWDVDQGDISQVNFMYPADSSFSIKKAGANSWTSDGDTLSGGSTSSTLRELSSLRADGFVDSLSVNDFGTEQYAIQLQLKSGEQHRLRLKTMPADTNNYIGVAQGFPYVFKLNKSSWDRSVLKSRSDLLKK